MVLNLQKIIIPKLINFNNFQVRMSSTTAATLLLINRHTSRNSSNIAERQKLIRNSNCRQFTVQSSLINFLKMNYFVIGVSGVTCGGKTTLSQLLQRSFPWCRVVYQDSYFLDDDDPRHVRLPEVENHVNYEVPTALDLDKMEEDVKKILSEEPVIVEYQNGNHNIDLKIPNMEESGRELLEKIGSMDLGTKKYRKVPILLLEGHILFCRDFLYDCCDARFFLNLTEAECWSRRSERTTYIPPDVPGYFEKCVWPEYVSHYEDFVKKRGDGIKIFSGSEPIEGIWRESVELIGKEIEKKFLYLVENK